MGLSLNIGLQDDTGAEGLSAVCDEGADGTNIVGDVFFFWPCPSVLGMCDTPYAVDQTDTYRYIRPPGIPSTAVLFTPTDTTGSFMGSNEFELAVDLSPMNGGAGFPFYGTSYTSAVMDLNGKLMLGSGPLVGMSDFGNTPCPPNGIPQPLIMVAYDNLEDGGYAIGFESTCPRVSQFGGPLGCMVIVWANVEHYYDDFKKRGANPPWEYV